MSDKVKRTTDDTVRIQRPPPRVFTDHCGRNVWMGDVEPLELDLDEPLGADPYNSAVVVKLWSHD